MRDAVVLCFHALVTIIRITRPGGVRSLVAESILLKHQVLILNRSRRRAPNLRISDRFIAGVCSLFIKPRRLGRVAIVLKPSTLLNFPSRVGATEISAVVFAKAQEQARAKGSRG